MMTKEREARYFWRQWNPNIPFDSVVDHCIDFDGVVYFGPDGVLLLSAMGDTWICQLALGDLDRLFALVPFPKAFIAWSRASRGRPDRITVLPWERFRQLLSSHGKIHQGSRLVGEKD